MAFYAVDEDDLIPATNAEKKKIYYCLECFGPVKAKRSKKNNGFSAHFYHLRPSPACRLYSKSEDHMCAQVQLQKFFPPGALQLERPFPEIGRVADLCWAERNIVFEIQCSPLTEAEAASRIADYRTAGFHTVWLLDDKRYNKRVLRPAETFLRERCCYYLHISQGKTSICYDQYEIFDPAPRSRRLRKSRPLIIDLRKPFPVPTISEDSAFPAQTLRTLQNSSLYFQGGRIDRALRSSQNPSLTVSMENWRYLERHFAALLQRRPKRWQLWLFRWIARPYLRFLDRILRSL